MNRIPKRHHYIPRLYLSGFVSCKKKKQLWVFNKKELKQYQTSIEKTACEKYFYDIDIPELGFDYVENAIGEVESNAAAAINEVLNELRIPAGDNFNYLMEFIALQAARVPSTINRFKSFYKSKGEKEANTFADSEESYKNFFSLLDETLQVKYKEVSYEKIKDFVLNKKYFIEVNNLPLMILMFEMYEKILPSFLKREWSIIYIKTGIDFFICSDNPVIVYWNKPRPVSILSSHVYQMIEDTEIIFPLSKEVALIGQAKRQYEKLEATVAHIAHINTLIYKFAEQFIYSTEENFKLSGRNKATGIISIIDYKPNITRVQNSI